MSTYVPDIEDKPKQSSGTNCIAKAWRPFIESPPKAVKVDGVSDGEFLAAGEEVELKVRAEAEIQKRKNEKLNKSHTWFYPFQNSYELVLGWNHGVVLKLGKQGWELEWLFQWLEDENHVFSAGDKFQEVEMKGSAATEGWKVSQLDKPLPLSRVTTYNATSCSVTVAFPKADCSRLMICHVDASPPLPIPAMIAWCKEMDGVKKQSCSSSKLEEFCVIASICPGKAEKAKFSKDAWIGKQAQTFDFQTLLLVRAHVAEEEIAEMENHTQFGLLLPSDAAPLFGGFIGWPRASNLYSLYRLPNVKLIETLAPKLETWDSAAETTAQQLINSLIDKSNNVHWMFHKLCSSFLFSHRGEMKHEDWSRPRMYVDGMFSIMNNPMESPYQEPFSKIFQGYQQKVWIRLSADDFATYCE